MAQRMTASAGRRRLMRGLRTTALSHLSPSPRRQYGRVPLQACHINERPRLEAGQAGLNDCMWVIALADAKSVAQWHLFLSLRRGILLAAERLPN